MIQFRLRPAAALVLVVLAAVTLPAEYPGDSVTIGFVGDIMTHNSQLRRAWKGTDASGRDLGYDFAPSFEWFEPYLRAPDLTVGNLETTFGGPNSALMTDEQYAFREYQAYPTFTTPDELAPALKDAGFDLLGTANNHAMDSNLTGAARTVRVLTAAGLPSTGTAETGRPQPWRGRVGGFSVSVLAWTASVNGLIASRGMESINVFSARGGDERLDQMLQDIRAEADRNPDLLVLCIHWGQEYFDEPDRYQRNLADLAIEAGADVIIGSHPHVFQPVERRIIEDEQGRREVFIAWSMGNFISSQRHIEGEREWVDGSAMLNLTVRRSPDGRARVSGFSAVPLYVRWSERDIRVLAVGDALAPGSAVRYGLSARDLERLNDLEDWIPGQLTRYLGALPARRDGAYWRVDFPE